MPKYCSLDKDFFKTWSPNMAYVLGYIAADGNISIGKRGNCYLALEGIDGDLIHGIRKALGASHKISIRHRVVGHSKSYRLQIGSKIMVNDLISLGLTPNKSKRLKMPIVSDRYLGDFVRGYFDGDGNINFKTYRRTDRKNSYGQHVRLMFVSSSRSMMYGLRDSLKCVSIIGGHLTERANCYRLYYYRIAEIRKIYDLFYSHIPALYLMRKFVYFREALKQMGGGA